MKKESIEELMERIALENDFEGERFSTYSGVSPEVVLTYLYGQWNVELRCKGRLCCFVGEKAEEIYKLKIWKKAFDGENAYEVLRETDAVCYKFRCADCILTADIERS